jgi:hypothetical protein
MSKYFESDWFQDALRCRNRTENHFHELDELEPSENTHGDAFEFSRETINQPRWATGNHKAQWYPKSRIIELHGYRIEGMVYFGTGLTAVKGQGSEPALINPFLKAYTPNPAYKGQDLPY